MHTYSALELLVEKVSHLFLLWRGRVWGWSRVVKILRQ
jgi:hypothetical protein